MALPDERLILPVEKAAVEVRGGPPSRDDVPRASQIADFYSLSAGKLTDNGPTGQLVANDPKVSRDAVVRLFCLSWSGLIGFR